MKFREAQQRATKLDRQLQEIQQSSQSERAKLEQQLKAIEADKAKIAEEHELLTSLLNEHPEIAEELYKAVSGQPGARRVGRPAAAPAVATLPPELTKKLERVDQVVNYIEQDRQQRARQAQAEADRTLGMQLDGQLKDLLTAKSYDLKMLPAARFYVLARAQQIENADLQDVPPLFAEWVGMMENFYNQRVQALRDGKQADAQLPVTPGPTPSPVTGAPAKGANDAVSREKLLAALRDRLGWGKEQGG